MARRPSKHLRPPRPLSTSFARHEAKREGTWVVQPLAAGRSTKAYICPHCQRSIPAGAAHVVAWPSQPRVGSTSAVEDRRHFHTACWELRS